MSREDSMLSRAELQSQAENKSKKLRIAGEKNLRGAVPTVDNPLSNNSWTRAVWLMNAPKKAILNTRITSLTFNKKFIAPVHGSRLRTNFNLACIRCVSDVESPLWYKLLSLMFMCSVSQIDHIRGINIRLQDIQSLLLDLIDAIYQFPQVLTTINIPSFQSISLPDKHKDCLPSHLWSR